jgi:hypothetical protein
MGVRSRTAIIMKDKRTSLFITMVVYFTFECREFLGWNDRKIIKNQGVMGTEKKG